MIRSPPAPRPSRDLDPRRRMERSRDEEQEPEDESKPSVKGRFLKEGRNFLFDFIAGGH